MGSLEERNGEVGTEAAVPEAASPSAARGAVLELARTQAAESLAHEATESAEQTTDMPSTVGAPVVVAPPAPAVAAEQQTPPPTSTTTTSGASDPASPNAIGSPGGAASAAASTYAVNVRSIDGSTFQVSVPSDQTGADLKRLIAQHSGVAAERQRLIFRGRIIQDHDSINQHIRESGQTIHLTPVMTAPAGGNAAAAGAEVGTESGGLLGNAGLRFRSAASPAGGLIVEGGPATAEAAVAAAALPAAAAAAGAGVSGADAGAADGGGGAGAAAIGSATLAADGNAAPMMLPLSFAQVICLGILAPMVFGALVAILVFIHQHGGLDKVNKAFANMPQMNYVQIFLLCMHGVCVFFGLPFLMMMNFGPGASAWRMVAATMQETMPAPPQQPAPSPGGPTNAPPATPTSQDGGGVRGQTFMPGTFPGIDLGPPPPVPAWVLAENEGVVSGPEEVFRFPRVGGAAGAVGGFPGIPAPTTQPRPAAPAQPPVLNNAGLINQLLGAQVQPSPTVPVGQTAMPQPAVQSINNAGFLNQLLGELGVPAVAGGGAANLGSFTTIRVSGSGATNAALAQALGLGALGIGGNVAPRAPGGPVGGFVAGGPGLAGAPAAGQPGAGAALAPGLSPAAHGAPGAPASGGVGANAAAPATGAVADGTGGNGEAAGASNGFPWAELQHLLESLGRSNLSYPLPPSSMPCGELDAFLMTLQGAVCQLGVGASDLQAALREAPEHVAEETTHFADALEAAATAFRGASSVVLTHAVAAAAAPTHAEAAPAPLPSAPQEAAAQ
eukprot:TRINITY_DN1892_c0_g2_i1.p1 TRINITY_DN1892_c0_g2~~TRINITY_DN1892_c0_g2_i1.p1  ORF type:complete len:785 (-),score=178.50 TRINITY_DN1892_c0_g2_i1:42-2396(-)